MTTWTWHKENDLWRGHHGRRMANIVKTHLGYRLTLFVGNAELVDLCDSLEGAKADVARYAKMKNPFRATAKKTNKYNAKRVVINGQKYDSKFEADRGEALKLMQAAGEISNLKFQWPYPIIVNGVKVCTYRADFVYEQGGKVIVEDAKGVQTQKFVLVKKLMKAVHEIDVQLYRTNKE